MKNFCYLFYILFLSISAWASDVTNYIGPTDLSGVQLSNIIITGPAKLSNVNLNSAKVTGTLDFKKLSIAEEANIIGPVNGSLGKFKKLDVIGPVELQKSEIDSLNVVGPINLKNVNIIKDANIVGSLEAKKSIFHDIIITAETIKLSETNAGNITIKINSQILYLKGKQILEINNKTIISGNITFESKMGKIIISKDSRINGKVIGAEIHNLESKT